MTLKSGSWVIQDHRKWHYSIDRILVPIDIPLTMALSCIVSEIKRYTGCKSRFATHPAFSSHVRGSPSEYCHKVWYGKTRMVWLPDAEKSTKIRPQSTRFDRIHELDARTDRRTDTARRQAALVRSIGRQKAEDYHYRYIFNSSSCSIFIVLIVIVIMTTSSIHCLHYKPELWRYL